ncbi:pig-Q [Gurleya vavrai]
MDEPIGIKQNKMINQQIGQTFVFCLDIANNQNKYFKPFLLIIILAIFSKIIINAFGKILLMLKEIFDIFQGKNYNRLKKRDDKIDYEYDRIVFATVIFSIFCLIIYNIIGYYLLFLVCFYFYKLMNFLGSIFDFFFTDLSMYKKKCYIEDNCVKYIKITKFEKLFFAFKYALKFYNKK